MAWLPARVSLVLSCLSKKSSRSCHNYSFWTFLFLFLWWNKKLNWVSSELNPYTVSDTLKKIVHVLSCAGDHVYRLFYLAVGKLADIPFRDVNFLRYFGCSNICFLEFFISLANSRLTWRNCRANAAKNRSKGRRYFKENRARHSLSLLLQITSH